MTAHLKAFPLAKASAEALNLPDALEEVAALIHEDLLQVESVIQQRLKSQVPSVTQIASHIVGSGGKRIRPVLCILVAKALGYQSPRTSFIAAAIEFVHTATLLHDDVIDNAELRRGRPSCNAIWDNKMSVLVGDFLYCQVSSMVTEDGDLRILKCITDATATTTEGEVLEITRSRDLTLNESEYFKIIEFKTGVLMSCATQIGAILGKAPKELEIKMRDFGMDLGIAFQLADDVLDYDNAVEEFGKSQGIDLKEGKVTLPLLHALQRCNENEREIIREATISSGYANFTQVLEILRKYDSLDHSLQLAARKVEHRRHLLSLLPDNPYRDALMRITDYVTERRK